MTAAYGLLERGEELRRLQAALARGSAGSGSLMVIEGPAGIGKTALLAAARAGAEASGMQVLTARGAELEREFAFGVVRQLFEPPLAQAGAEELDRVAAGSSGAGGVRAGPAGPRRLGARAERRARAALRGPPRALLAVRQPRRREADLRDRRRRTLGRRSLAALPGLPAPTPGGSGRGAGRRGAATRVICRRGAAGDAGHRPQRRASADRSAHAHRGGPVSGRAPQRHAGPGLRRGLPARDPRDAISHARARGGAP